MSRHLIYTPHGLSFLQQNESVRKRSLYKLIEQTMARVGGDIVACSHSEAATLASIGVACTVIPNGVPVGGQPAPLPKGPPFTVVTAGRLTHAKNPSLFSTIAQAFVGDDSVRFVWIGDGELRADLTSPNIEMRGWMHPDEVRATLRNAHVYLSTSLWEGLPLAVLEAMDAGLPLLLSDCVGNRDLVDAKNGYSFNTSADAVCKLRSMLQSLTALRAMGEESRLAFLKHYTVGRMVESYLAQYRSHRAIRDPDA
jgi:glycosyltransferase involved in cell wall biosynthesis